MQHVHTFFSEDRQKASWETYELTNWGRHIQQLKQVEGEENKSHSFITKTQLESTENQSRSTATIQGSFL